MPFIDMPLEEMREYRGISPRPADLDAYWERALALLDGQSLSYTLERDGEFEARDAMCCHLYFTGVGGARIHCKLVRPTLPQGPLPAVVLFHGYRGESGEWFDKLPFCYNGMVVAAMDVRGQAGASEDNLTVRGNTVVGHIVRGIDEEDPQRLAFKFIYLDTVQLVRILMSMDFVDAGRIGAAGASQGGALALACAALEPRVKRAAAACPFLCDFKRVKQLDLMQMGTAYEEIHRYLRYQDPLHQGEKRFWERLGYLDIKNLAPRIRAEVLLFTGLMDTACPPSTQFAAFNAISAPKEHVLYPEWGHETYPGSNDRILQFMRGL